AVASSPLSDHVCSSAPSPSPCRHHHDQSASALFPFPSPYISPSPSPCLPSSTLSHVPPSFFPRPPPPTPAAPPLPSPTSLPRSSRPAPDVASRPRSSVPPPGGLIPLSISAENPETDKTLGDGKSIEGMNGARTKSYMKSIADLSHEKKGENTIPSSTKKFSDFSLKSSRFWKWRSH
ncbi:hypothetical protein PENTCL1PPCAC_10758, partial [Pristionchus entomophagus]